MLESYFVAARTVTKLRSGPTGPFIDEFAGALREAGYARHTARQYLPEVTQLGAWMEAESVALASLNEDALDRFAARRMFLRYLATQGLCNAYLLDAVPTIAQWRLSSLPAYLAPEDVERLVGAPDPKTPVGQRDRAILLLLARLGLRAGDVRGLCLGHIDWKAGTLLVAGKGRRPTRLPLPQEVGDAILAYVSNGRPRVNDEHVFLLVHAPYRPFQGSSSISLLVHAAAKRAGGRLPPAPA